MILHELTIFAKTQRQEGSQFAIYSGATILLDGRAIDPESCVVTVRKGKPPTVMLELRVDQLHVITDADVEAHQPAAPALPAPTP